MDHEKPDNEINPSSQPEFKPIDQARVDQARLDRALDADRTRSMADEGGASGAWRELREQLDDKDEVSVTIVAERRRWREWAAQRRWAVLAGTITATAAGILVGFMLWRRRTVMS